MNVGIWKRRAERLPKLPAAPRPPEQAMQPSPDFLAPTSNVRPSLAADSEVSGRLSFSSPTRIDGILHGEVLATETLVIGESGFVDGTIRALNLVILGHVEGDVLGADRVEIGPQGTLHGAIETRALVVQEGGQLNGDCRPAVARRNVHLLHPRPAVVETATPERE